MFYIALFSVTEILFLLGEFFLKNKNKILFWIFGLLAIFILCYFAGVRDFSVGADVETYVVKANEIANSSTIEEYFNFFGKNEYLYYGLIYVSSRFDQSLFLTLFLNEFVIVFPVFLSLYLMRNKVCISLGMLIYLFLFYNLSFCYLRQFFAVSLGVLSYVIFDRRKIISILLLISIAFIHFLSVLFIVIIIFCKLKLPKFVYFLSIFICLLGWILIPEILNLLKNIGILPAVYIESFYDAAETSGLPIGELVIYSVLYLICIKFCLKRKKYDLFAIFSIGIITILISVSSSYFSRISFYFKFFLILYLPIIYKKIKNRDNKIFFALLVLVLVILAWFWIVVRIDSENTYPYIFRNT